ncbi:MAG: hypothetical protein ACK5HO_06675, partial [Pseudomonadota bacterium]
ISCCFDSHPRIDSVPQKPGFRYGLLENAIYAVLRLKTIRNHEEGKGVECISYERDCNLNWLPASP